MDFVRGACLPSEIPIQVVIVADFVLGEKLVKIVDLGLFAIFLDMVEVRIAIVGHRKVFAGL